MSVVWSSYATPQGLSKVRSAEIVTPLLPMSGMDVETLSPRSTLFCPLNCCDVSVTTISESTPSESAEPFIVSAHVLPVSPAVYEYLLRTLERIVP